MIIHSNLSEIKNKILPTCLQGNYGDSLGSGGNWLRFHNRSSEIFGLPQIINHRL